ncbi:MAG: hypothetical protein JWO06_461 [Bacteroidota bacterium]|nr:hypothetical protein [Bacteroidota bacterium]
MNRFKRYLFPLVLMAFIFGGCGKKAKTTENQTTTPPPPITSSTDVIGYNLLSKICGIWDGGVTSTTALGSYPEWVVDFRPISASQVSAKNELDTANDIFMSFFITYHNSEYKMAFRNGGSFASRKRVSYMEVDSVSETSGQSYYRFVDFVKGSSRTITEVIFKQDSLVIRSFTNKYNTLTTPTLHMEWRAKLQDATSCQNAIAAFGFPQKTLVKDFSTTFKDVTESVYYDLSSDPYSESSQPYLGKSTLSFTVGGGLTLDPSKTVMLVVTTQPLISPPYTFNFANLAYRSRYVILSASNSSFTFNYMHPGTYYLYAFYDKDGNRTVNSGDYVSTTNTTFTLPENGTTSATTQINFAIP